MKVTAAVVVCTAASASAFAPQPAFKVSSTALNMDKGAGGMFDTRDPETMDHEDPRKSISAAPSFEEYLKSRGGRCGQCSSPSLVMKALNEPVRDRKKEEPAAEGGFTYGEYDEVMWDNDAKKDVYNKWDPSSPRSTRNFNPFETWEGNSPDASGIYPGENRYKDPIRPDISYAIMLEEKAEAEERNASPKAGS
eukprot:CAMPEP_0113569780 /NCGR_PEP_ID=MMETSP0015_2-20120614/24602_1 /TAXON_ID=2838 /ORGANISM="Odontella" /LENGTH=193 /DNA_ID=CAMNT_0000472485 /DNA_START=154 /DNA_END=731 /DNA_ORIENTATION=+ /assembly_acc=CAM_ASM_000160